MIETYDVLIAMIKFYKKNYSSLTEDSKETLRYMQKLVLEIENSYE